MKDNYKKQINSSGIFGMQYNKLMILALITVLGLLVLFFSPFKTLNSGDPKIVEQELIESSKVAGKIYNAGPEPLTIPAKTQLINNDLLENSYLSKSKNSFFNKKNQECSLTSINQYREFLAIANSLMIKLNVGEDYSAELDELNKIEHPEEIQKVLKDFQEFSPKNDSKPESVKPLGTFLSKIFKVTKNNETYNDANTRKIIINEDVKIFSDYIYSTVVLEKFVKCQN